MIMMIIYTSHLFCLLQLDFSIFFLQSFRMHKFCHNPLLSIVVFFCKSFNTMSTLIVCIDLVFFMTFWHKLDLLLGQFFNDSFTIITAWFDFFFLVFMVTLINYQIQVVCNFFHFFRRLNLTNSLNFNLSQMLQIHTEIEFFCNIQIGILKEFILCHKFFVFQ